MAELLEQIEELLDEADDLDHGPAQVAIVERAVELADAHGEVGVGYFARNKLVEAATFAGRADVAMVAFSWLLAKYDADPESYDGHEILWRYKWILDCVADFPSIPKAQIDSLFDDMKRRYKASGASLHAYWGLRRNCAVAMGDADEAMRADAKIRQAPRDGLSNCPACVQDEEVEYATFIGEDAAAVKAAKPILSGRMKCGEVPERTYACVMMPLLRLGKHSEALDHYRTGYRLVRRNPKFVRHKAMFLTGLTLTGNLDRAMKLLDRHLPEALDSASPWWRFEFFLASRLFLEKLTEAGQTTLPIRVPDKLGLAGIPTVAGLATSLDGRLMELAEHFDARNGNGSFVGRCLCFRDLFGFAKTLPI